MVRYLNIMPLQEPMDLGLNDSAVLSQVGFNVLIRKRSSPDTLMELIRVLSDAGVGVENVSLFGSSAKVLPEKGSYVALRETGGVAPEGTHNDGPAAYRRPSVQVIAYSESYSTARLLAHQAYDALVAVRNRDVA